MTTTAQTQTTVHDSPNGSHAGAVGAPPSAILTRDGMRVLKEELERLRHELEGGMAERLREARAFGAPAGNDEYLQIQEEEIILAVRAARLDALLERAQVVGSATLDGRADVGTIVEVEDMESGELVEHELVGGHEALRADAASAASPIGQALLGREAGEIVEVHLPKGRIQRLEIVRVNNAPSCRRLLSRTEPARKNSGHGDAKSLPRTSKAHGSRSLLGHPQGAPSRPKMKGVHDVQERDRRS